MENTFVKNLANARDIICDERGYADSYLDNILQNKMDEKHIRMFCRGEGKELYPKDGKREKAACVYSSSMLAYNFFSWIDQNHPFYYADQKYDKVFFEEQFRVLKSRNNKANLDVVLVSEDNNTILLFESKFTEHFKTGKVDIKDAYYKPDSYFCYGDNWVSVFQDLQNRMAANKNAYYEGLKQVACHLIGISSAVLDDSARQWFNDNSWMHRFEDIELKKENETVFIFKSIVFHPKTKEEGTASQNYEELNKEFVEGIKFLPENLVISSPIITYRHIWDNGMRDSIQDPKLRAFLERYLVVHV
jgi:hypothetical protein